MNRSEETDPQAHNLSPSAPWWFPGDWLGGAALLLAPALMLAGVLLRIQFNFFFPHQLEAYAAHPRLMMAAYSCFLAGNILLWPAVLTVTGLIGLTHPGWARWGGSLTLFGLFARTFHAGVDHLAFQLVRAQGAPAATAIVAGAYGAFHIVATLNAAILSGWVVLAIGAYRSGVFGLVRSISLGLMAMLMLGSLKGTSATSIIATVGLCAAMVPLGITMLAERLRANARQFFLRLGFAVALVAIFFWLGQRG